MSSSTVRPAPLALASRRAETFRFRLALSSHRARRVPSRAVLARCSNASSSPSRTSAATEAFALGASLASDPIPLASLASNSAAQDAFDVVVWGATGFTGRLVARHLARHAPPSLRWAVAARSDDKLRALVGELVDRGDAETLVPMFHGDAADADDMTGLAAVSRCVISAAGPTVRTAGSSSGRALAPALITRTSPASPAGCEPSSTRTTPSRATRAR